MARRRTRKRSPRSSASPPTSLGGKVLSWLLVVGVAVLGAWLWYRGAREGRAMVEGLTIERSEPSGFGFEVPPFDSVATPPEPGTTPPKPAPTDPPPSRPRVSVESPVAVVSPVSAVPPALEGTGVVGVAVGKSGVGTNGLAEASGVSGREAREAREGRLRLSTEAVVGVQLAMARRGFSSGSIDGVIGAQTKAALRAFQRAEGLPVTGEPDPVTLARLDGGSTTGGILTNYTPTAEDLARLAAVPRTWLGKASRGRLDYETPLEMVAEKSHSHPRLIRGLNPGIDWSNVSPGTVVRLPVAALPTPRGRAALIRISLSDKTLRAYDVNSNLLVQFPCSIARKAEKRPVGVLKVARLAPNPSYRFDPEIFPESEEGRRLGRKLMIPPGPNNPVGTAWIGLNRPGYGIHGTPNPEEVGRTESHGCFRLSNWNAEHLLKLAWVGLPVQVVP